VGFGYFIPKILYCAFKQNFASLYRYYQVLNVVNKVKYLGHIIGNYLNDDDDAVNLFGQADMCTDDLSF